MKINYRRIIKVLSSCVAIAMVLVVTVAMPVLAFSNTVYSLSSLVLDKYTEGDIAYIKYDFKKAGVIPYIYAKNGSKIQEYETSDRLEFKFSPITGRHTWDLRLYPFGVTGNDTSKSAFLDISDLKPLESVTLRTFITVDVGITSSVSGVDILAYWAVTWVAVDGSVLGSTSDESFHSTTTNASDQALIDVDYTVTIPEDAVYMIPQVRVLIESAGYNQAGTIYLDYDRGIMYASYNAVLQNTATMFAIQDQLGDIQDGLDNINQSIDEGNNKLDEIINGNDDMSSQAQDKHEDQQELDSAAQDAMNDIDDRTDLDNVLPEGAMDPEDLAGYADWSDDEAWVQWRYLLSPLFDNELVVEIMMALIAFINISVIFMGR